MGGDVLYNAFQLNLEKLYAVFLYIKLPVI